MYAEISNLAFRRKQEQKTLALDHHQSGEPAQLATGDNIPHS